MALKKSTQRLQKVFRKINQRNPKRAGRIPGSVMSYKGARLSIADSLKIARQRSGRGASKEVQSLDVRKIR